ncbi:MAG TPA: histidine kinase dimerization/phospho-acceptor domain-containing protein, partial [Thermodesulfobacteriota bacterium]|nr:histidine kinase dimerization/phospho-acceptor domain-containing protein [Thermodesulfobacteriota bacterium]
SKTITEVSSRLAHEIRNPLASAGGYARRLLSSMNPAAPEREKVQIIVNEVARLEGILGMILKSLQPLELRLERVDLKVLMQDVLSAIRPAVHDRGVQVDLELPPGIPPISADRLKMGLALQTLLRKAVSQMPEAEVLNISISRDQKNCRIAVRYPVAEMLPGDVEHFFYPFITPRTGYDTWDLPSAQILIHKHGGLIEVKSREAKKFFVDISIPLAPPLNSSN